MRMTEYFAPLEVSLRLKSSGAIEDLLPKTKTPIEA
jgi:hypothetical protein